MRLVDCYMELFYYTLFLKSMDFGHFSYADVFKHYVELFKKAATISEKAGFSKEAFETSLFALCAWIDETVMESQWKEKKQWISTSLQMKLYHTTNAGVLFFEKLTGLSEDEINIREVYMYCLTLGFRGKFFSPDDESRLRGIVDFNTVKLSGSPNISLPDILFPESYAWLDSTPPKRKRMPARILLNVGLIGVPFIFFIVLFLFLRGILTAIPVGF